MIETTSQHITLAWKSAKMGSQSWATLTKQLVMCHKWRWLRSGLVYTCKCKCKYQFI